MTDTTRRREGVILTRAGPVEAYTYGLAPGVFDARFEYLGETRSVRARSRELAVLALARRAYEERHALGMVGPRYLAALKTAQTALPNLLHSRPDYHVLAWRMLARSLGYAARASKKDLAGKFADVHERWTYELRATILTVETYLSHLRMSGPMGRSGVLYPIVLADPPWQFEDRGTRLAPDCEQAGKQYEVLPLPEIEALGELIPSARDAILFLWCPNALICQGVHQRVMDAWGFSAKTLITWTKLSRKGTPRLGGGHYTRGVTEQLVIGSRGRGAALRVDAGVPNWISAPQGTHSEKPDAAYALIEKLYGPRDRLELFARRTRAGWDAWGDEAPGAGEIGGAS